MNIDSDTRPITQTTSELLLRLFDYPPFPSYQQVSYSHLFIKFAYYKTNHRETDNYLVNNFVQKLFNKKDKRDSLCILCSEKEAKKQVLK